MTTDTATALIPTAAALLFDDTEAASRYARRAKSEATKRAYRSDWSDFVQYCEARGLACMPATPATITRYLAHLADARGYKLSTIRRRVASISQAHRYAGHDSPTRSIIIEETLAGIANTIGSAPDQKAAAITDDIKAMIEHCPNTTKGKRDRAILLLGFAGAFRRSELVALQIEDIDTRPRDGMICRIRRSKTNQAGELELVAINYGSNEKTCPVRAYKAWLKHAGITSGAAFRSIDRHGNIKAKATDGRTVAEIVKHYAALAGLDPELYSGHSLRAGLVTSALDAGATLHDAMKQSRHRDEKVARKYDRGRNLFKNNVSGRVGL